MPSGPLAHICFLVSDLDKAVEDWGKILGVLDPGQLDEPIVRYDRFTAGEDDMAWATFVSHHGAEIQLLCPLNDGPLGRRLARHGEGVHHIAFVTEELEQDVERLVEAGVEVTSTELQQDPLLPWQHWTFVAPSSSHGLLVEVARPYRAVEGRWEPGSLEDGSPGASAAE